MLEVTTVSFKQIADFKQFSAEKYQKNSLFATNLTALDVYCLQPGQSQKLHAHKGNDKYYVIWEGIATVQVGDEIRELGPGGVALSEPGIEHSISNQSSEPVVALVFQAPKHF